MESRARAGPTRRAPVASARPEQRPSPAPGLRSFVSPLCPGDCITLSFSGSLREEIDHEPVRLAYAEAPVPPALVRQPLRDQEPALDRPAMEILHRRDLDHHERPLGRPFVPEVRRR